MKENWLNTNVKSLIALIIVIWGFLYFSVCSVRNIKPDPQILIAVVSLISGVGGYYFGASASSNKPQDKSVVNTADVVNVDTK